MDNRPWKILLIEDDEEDYLLTRLLLAEARGSQFELDWKQDYASGLAALLAQAPDVALVDYRLGRRNGLDLIREAVARGCSAPMILLTGQGSYSIDLEAMKAGATDYLAKNEVSAPLLERTIRYAVERHQTQMALIRAQEELEARVRARTEELRLANERLAEANAAIDAERRRLFALLDELPAFVYLQGLDHIIRFANRQARSRFGELCGRRCFEAFFQISEPCPDCPTLEVWKERRSIEWETTYPDDRSYQIYDYPFADIDGSQLILKVAIDITARKKVEAELERNNRELMEVSSAERLQRQLAEALVQTTIALNTSLNLDDVLDHILAQAQTVISSCAVAVMLIEEGMVRTVRNRGFEDHPESWQILGVTFPVDGIPPIKQMCADLRPVVVADTNSDPEWSGIPGLAWVHSYAAIPLQVEGQIIGFLAIMSPEPNFFGEEVPGRLTAFAAHAAVAIHNAHLYKEIESALNKEQAMRAQLIQAEKFAAMGRMVGSVAHELNNPLQTIKNCLYLTQQELSPDSPSQEFLQMAYSETQRLSNLVTQLRELYRPNLQMPQYVLDLRDILKQIHALLMPQLGQNRVTWQFDPGDAPVLVQGNEDQLKQVFLNICTNGIEAMQPGGGALSLRVNLDQAAGQVGLAIADNGPGIDPEKIDRIFEPFFTTKPNGLGLGLPICYEIINQHKGRIAVESVKNQGTTFTVWLPLASK